MKAVVVTEPGQTRSVRCTSLPIPKPESGQVLIKVAAAPIHPADLSIIKRIYGDKPQDLPAPGIEGAGTVLSSGGGLLGWLLTGKRVAFRPTKCGSWGEYAVARAKDCIVLQANISLEQGSMLIMNPFTCCMFMDVIKSKGSPAVIQTGAASTCGKMLFRYCKYEKIPIINIVYRPDQTALLRELGAEYVLCSSDSDFGEQLQALAGKLVPAVAFDCVAGPVTGQVLGCLQPGSVLYLYGFLSMRLVEEVQAADLLFSGKRIEGLILRDWIRQQGVMTGMRYAATIQRLFHEVFYSAVNHTFPLDDIQSALESFRTDRSLGKVLLTPS